MMTDFLILRLRREPREHGSLGWAATQRLQDWSGPKDIKGSLLKMFLLFPCQVWLLPVDSQTIYAVCGVTACRQIEGKYGPQWFTLLGCIIVVRVSWQLSAHSLFILKGTYEMPTLCLSSRLHNQNDRPRLSS